MPVAVPPNGCRNAVFIYSVCFSAQLPSVLSCVLSTRQSKVGHPSTNPRSFLLYLSPTSLTFPPFSSPSPLDSFPQHAFPLHTLFLGRLRLRLPDHHSR